MDFKIVVGARRLLDDIASDIVKGELITEENTGGLAANSASDSIADSRTKRPGRVDEAAEWMVWSLVEANNGNCVLEGLDRTEAHRLLPVSAISTAEGF